MKPVSYDEFCNFTFPSGVSFSPNGKTLCFVATKANKAKNCYEANLCLKRGAKIIQLTNGGKEHSFRYLDDKTILFLSDREGEKEPSLRSVLYSISTDGGEAKKHLTFPIPVDSFLPLKNGDYIVTAETIPGYEDLYLGDAKLQKKYFDEKKRNEDYHVLTRNPWWFNGGSYTDGAYSSIFYYSKKTRKLRRLTDTGFEAMDVKLSSDERFLFFRGKKVTPLDDYLDLGFFRMELASGKTDTILPDNRALLMESYVLCDDFILAAACVPQHGINSNMDFYRFDYETLQPTFYAKLDGYIGSAVGSDVRYGGGKAIKAVGNTVYFISTVFDSAYLFRLRDGNIEKLIDKEGSVDCFDVSGDKIAVSALWDIKGPELYDGSCKPLTHYNDRLLKNKYTAIPERLNCGRDGRDIHGFVLKPLGFDPAKKYPVVFDIHGGPKTVYGEVYYHEMQLWAGKGYFVIYCNPTGSEGRGDDFADIRGKYGTVDYEDLMHFCDLALDTYPQMDRDRVFETGGSYGGFMTNWIIGHTDRFRACASQRSISNWFSFYGVSDIGNCFAEDQNLATPWSDPEKLWWHSPLKYADKVKTPTLFIHSEQDYRCPIDQGYQMYTALVTHGVDTRLVQFKGENHDLSRTGKPLHRIRRLEEITGWFERYL